MHSEHEVKTILFDKQQIQKRVKALANQISTDFKGEEVVLVGILRGAFIFLADLSRELDVPANLGFIKVTSYGDKKTSSKKPRLTKKLDVEITGKNVVVNGWLAVLAGY